MATQHQLDEGTMAIIRESAREAAREVMKDHRSTCRVEELALEVWGAPGVANGALKPKVAMLVGKVSALEAANEKRGLRLWQFLQPILSTIAAAFLLHILKR